MFAKPSAASARSRCPVAGSSPAGAAEALSCFHCWAAASYLWGHAHQEFYSVPQAILSAPSRPLRAPAELASIITTVYQRIERDRRRNCWIYVRPIEEALAE